VQLTIEEQGFTNQAGFLRKTKRYPEIPVSTSDLVGFIRCAGCSDTGDIDLEQYLVWRRFFDTAGLVLSRLGIGMGGFSRPNRRSDLLAVVPQLYGKTVFAFDGEGFQG